MKTIRTPGGVHLAYSEVGTGEAIVWIPGTGLTGSTWSRQIDYFSSAFHCISLDLRGAGASTGGDEDFTVADMAEDVVALLDALDIGSAVLVGVSLGAAIAQEVAISKPDRVKALVLVACWSSTKAEHHIRRHFESRLYALENGPLDVFAQFAFWMSSPTLLDDEPDRQSRVESELALSTSTNLRGTAAHFRADLTHETRERLSRIGCPTLVVHGDEDLITRPVYNRVVAGLIPGASLVQVPAAGHLVWLERPDELNRAIADLLDQL